MLVFGGVCLHVCLFWWLLFCEEAHVFIHFRWFQYSMYHVFPKSQRVFATTPLDLAIHPGKPASQNVFRDFFMTFYPWTPKPWKMQVYTPNIWVINPKNEGCGFPFFVAKPPKRYSNPSSSFPPSKSSFYDRAIWSVLEDRDFNRTTCEGTAGTTFVAFCESWMPSARPRLTRWGHVASATGRGEECLCASLVNLPHADWSGPSWDSTPMQPSATGYNTAANIGKEFTALHTYWVLARLPQVCCILAFLGATSSKNISGSQRWVNFCIKTLENWLLERSAYITHTIHQTMVCLPTWRVDPLGGPRSPPRKSWSNGLVVISWMMNPTFTWKNGWKSPCSSIKKHGCLGFQAPFMVRVYHHPKGITMFCSVALGLLVGLNQMCQHSLKLTVRP